MRPLVSVIIPAHNPGRYIEPCIRSILRQSLPRDQFEVVFVDDGSTDGTGKRLDRLAREQPHVRVIHIPASGGPGRPRNIGLETALGEYVQFLDADDELAPTALERLLRMARANGSDIVLGKFASETLARRQDLFSRNRGATTLAETPQLADASMGPTKLFRLALLREHEITFPEGWRQMEDQLFTLRAYLAARVISILGDQPCYYFNKREDEGHISAELVDPGTHVAHLREVLDEVDRGVADEGLRRRLTARFYRAEVLSRLTGTQFVNAPEAYQESLFDALSGLARERFADSVRGLGAFPRIRSQLLQERHLADLITLAGRAADFAVEARVTDAGWTDGRLGLHFRATLSRGLEARPLTFVERDDALFLDPSVADDLVGPIDVTDEVSAIRPQVSLVDRETALEWIVPSTSTLSMQPVGDPDDEVRLPALVGFIELDPQRVGPGKRPLDDGAWDVQVRWLGLGMQSTGQLRLPHRALGANRPAIAPALVGRPVRWVVPGAGADGVLRIRIGGADRAPARIDAAARRLVRQGRGITVELPVATDRIGPLASGVLRLTDPAGAISLPAVFEGSLGMLDVAGVRNGRDIPRGRYDLTAHVGGEDAPGLASGTVVVRDDGQFVILGLRGISPLARLRSKTAWSIRSARKTVWKRARAAARRLPAWAKQAIRSAYGSLRA
jgi:hypothetical protein